MLNIDIGGENINKLATSELGTFTGFTFALGSGTIYKFVLLENQIAESTSGDLYGNS